MSMLDHALALLLVGFLPVNQYLGRHHLSAMLEFSTAQRVSFYRRMVVVQWIATFLLLTAWFLAGRSWEALGLSIRADRGEGFALALAALAIGASWLYSRRQLSDPRGRRRLRARVDRMGPFLPRTREAMPSFNALSVTAGICEEILYRGYFIWYASHWLGEGPRGLALAVLATSVVFALGHVYQGSYGMLTVFLVGLIHGALYVVAGSLWIPMLLHVLIDLSAGRVSLALHPEGDPGPDPWGGRRADIAAR